MIRGSTAYKLSTLLLQVIACTVAVLANVSDAFVLQPPVANPLVLNQLRQSIFVTTKRWNGQATHLFTSTAPSQSGNELLVIDSWEVLPDGRLKGIVVESGDSVLTSPLKKRSDLKEKMTVQTLSGSRYKLGLPASVLDASNNLSADQLGVPRASFGGSNSNPNSIRSTQPLKSVQASSPNGVMNKVIGNKGRETVSLQAESSLNSEDGGLEKKYYLFTPLVGGGLLLRSELPLAQVS